MNATTGELVSDTEEFFAPVASDLVDSLIGHYQSDRRRVEEIAEYFSSPSYSQAVWYFVEAQKDSARYAPEVSRLFNLEAALSLLNATYWDKALKMTDVLDCMPEKRRTEWFDQIQARKTPEFEEESVRATIGGLLLQRSTFFAERVDGIFKALSNEHVTNRPEGFSKRMIVASVHDGMFSGHRQQGHINDLRCVIARFMGRGEPKYGATCSIIDACRRNYGEWMRLDGGALKIKVFKKGTAHLEVHPDMAWRLNGVLASLYPSAIPSQFRERPPKKAREVVLMEKPLPFAVLEALAQARVAVERIDSRQAKSIPRSRQIGYEHDKHIRAEAEMVLTAIGGVPTEHYFQFDYDPGPVIDEIVCSGCIPDHKSHQFYPTPESLAAKAVEIADIQPSHTVLEPSAGIGGIADHIPPCSDLMCIEISDLHCKILEEKGAYVKCLDFIEWASSTRNRFDRIVMNPPFDHGRWLSHLEHAAKLLVSDGVLTAILPAGAQKRNVLPGFKLTWSHEFHNAFPGASVSVVILRVEK